MSTNNKRTERIRDPVHGLIVFGGNRDPQQDETDRIAWDLLNTPEFQRLRRIRQLGFSDLVFPGATHSRFAHSVGVYHMARRLAEVIARRAGGQQDHDRQRIALLAALLHDVGHGPFSHAFEAATEALEQAKRHEVWSAEIIRGDTGVNRVLRSVDEDLPNQIGALLAEEDPKDIYSAIVSSQFDADRLDYIQRDRLMTGVEFGHIDLEWLLDCLEVGSVTIGENQPDEAPCLYLGPKGVQVAEEYLEARFRLYRMVYMHKTTRAAEKMMEALLGAIVSDADDELTKREPVLSYLKSKSPTLESYIALDDSAVWAAMSTWMNENVSERVSILSKRLRERVLYKCVDIGERDKRGGNLYRKFKRTLNQSPQDWHNDLLYDEDTVRLYRWYDFDDESALNKVLVKAQDRMHEPEDIASVSEIVKALEGERRIQRVYAPQHDQANVLEELLKEASG